MNINYKRALVEVDQIIRRLDPSNYKKISPNLLNLINFQKDNRYRSHIRFDKPLTEQDLLPETKAILAVIYRLYLCT